MGAGGVEEGYCRCLAEEMESAWRRLPISQKLRSAPPIPLRTTLEVFKGSLEAERCEQVFHCPEVAVEAALKDAQPPVAVMLGEPGAGKSSATKWIARHFAEKVLAHGVSRDAPLPVYVDLGTWRDICESSDLERALAGESKRRKLKNVSCILWLLDGLDLLPDAGLLGAGSVLRDARSRAGSHEQFVLSSRPLPAVTGELKRWAQSSRLTLAPLDEATRREWVQRHCSEAALALACFEREKPEVACFLGTPLLFALTLSACLDRGKSFKCDEFPGRTGLFRGFMTYILQQAAEDGRISQREFESYEEKCAPVVHGVWWAAVRSRHDDRVPFGMVQSCLAEAFDATSVESNIKRWRQGARILEKAGALSVLPGQSSWGCLHQQFAEYWAGEHMSARLAEAARGGWYEAELWDGFREVRLDPVMWHALAILSRQPEGMKWLRLAFDSMKAASMQTACAMLAEVGNAEARTMLRPLLESEDEKERTAAAGALVALLDWETVEFLTHQVQATEDSWADSTIAESHGAPREAFAEAARSWLRDRTKPRRWKAAWSLGHLDQRRAIGLLRETAADPDEEPEVRLAAVEGLVSIKDEAAVPAIIALCGLPDPRVRKNVARRLRTSEDPKAVEALCALTRDADASVRACAVEALWGAQSPAALAALLAAIEDDDAEVRENAVAAACTAPILMRFAGDSEPAIRRLVARGLAGIAPTQETVACLWKLAGDADRDVCVRAARGLLEHGIADAAELLIEALADAEDETRESPELGLLIPLQKPGNERLIKRLIDAFHSTVNDAQVRARILWILREIGDDAVKQLVEGLSDSLAVKDGQSPSELGLALELACALSFQSPALARRRFRMLLPSPFGIKFLSVVKERARLSFAALFGHDDPLAEPVSQTLIAGLKDLEGSMYARPALAEMIAADLLQVEEVSKKAQDAGVPFEVAQDVVFDAGKRMEPWTHNAEISRQRQLRSLAMGTPMTSASYADPLSATTAMVPAPVQGGTVEPTKLPACPGNEPAGQTKQEFPEVVTIEPLDAGRLKVSPRGHPPFILEKTIAKVYELFYLNRGRVVPWVTIYEHCCEGAAKNRSPGEKARKTVIAHISNLKGVLRDHGMPCLADELRTTGRGSGLSYTCVRTGSAFQRLNQTRQSGGKGEWIDDISEDS